MTNTEIHTASNSDVVKLKGRASVMRQAWFQFKSMGVRPFAKALRGAWEALRAAVILDIKRAAVAASIKAENKALAIAKAARLKAQKKTWTGSKSSRSPLNPFRAIDTMGGKWGRAYCDTVAGR